MHFRHKLVRICNDHGAGANWLAGCWVIPRILDCGNRHDLSVTPSEIVGLLSLWRVVPFICRATRCPKTLGYWYQLSVRRHH